MEQPDKVTEIAKLLAGKLIERRDAKAVQMKGSKGQDMYVPHRVRRDAEENIPWRLQDLVDHVTYRGTFGHYVVSQNNTCRIFTFDIDIIKGACPQFPDCTQHSIRSCVWTRNRGIRYDPTLPLGAVGPQEEVLDPRAVWLDGSNPDAQQDMASQLRIMSLELAIRVKELLDIKVTVHFSGAKGVHVTGLLDPGTPAVEAREMSDMVLSSMDDYELFRGNNFWRTPACPALYVETFPKQAELSSKDGYGNLLRLPLGKNVKSGKKSFFVDLSAPITKWKEDDPILALTEGSLR